MNFFLSPFRDFVRYRRILSRTSLVELKAQYAGSALGVVWVLLGPLLLMAIYAVMFSVVLRVKPGAMSGLEYLMYMCTGLVSMLAFSTALMTSATSISKNRQVLLNTVFPAELLPVRAVIVSSTVLPVGLVLVIAASVLAGQGSWTLLLVPVVVLLQLMLSCGLGWLLSLLTLVVRDTPIALQYVTMALLFVTPIGYTPEMAPALFRALMYANPLTYYVLALQSLVVFGRLPSPAIIATAVMVGILAFAFGYWVFKRAKQTVLDYA